MNNNEKLRMAQLEKDYEEYVEAGNEEFREEGAAELRIELRRILHTLIKYEDVEGVRRGLERALLVINEATR
jgi:hypothetical protein